MKHKELKGLTKKERADKLTEMRTELMKLGASRSVGSGSKNPGQIKKLKRTIARLLTLQKEAPSKKA